MIITDDLGPSPDEGRPDADDLPHTFWHCEHCGAQNSCLDGECQFCDEDQFCDEV